MLLGQGRYQGARIGFLPASVALMTLDHLTDAQKEGMEMFFGDGYREFKAGLGIRYRRRHQARRSLLAEAVGLGPGLGTAGSWDRSRISPAFSSPNACWNPLFFRAP